MLATDRPAAWLAALLLLGSCGGSGEPARPSTAAAQAPHLFFVAPNGNDANPGTITRPFRTIGHGITKLQPGHTLYLRGGTYYEHTLLVRVAGTAASPITIRSYPGESAIVDGGFPEFRKVGNADWELVDLPRGIFRSTRQYSGADVVYGYMGESDRSYRLVPYKDFGPFVTDKEDYTETWPYYYIGPGVYWSPADRRIYIRVKRSFYQEAMGLLFPASNDPRQTVFYLFPSNRIFSFKSTASHIVLEQLDIRYGGNALRFAAGSHHIEVRNCRILGGRYHVAVDSGAHTLSFHGILVPDSLPPWIAWTDVKRPFTDRPGHSFQGAAIDLDGRVDGVEISNSVFMGLFDAITALDNPSNLHIHNCVFDGVRDDAVQLGTAAWNFQFNHNIVRNAYTGVSWHGSGTPPGNSVGTKYIHHNVIDTSVLQLVGRRDPDNLLGKKYRGLKKDGMASGRAFGSHSLHKATGPDPWKIYHNTIRIAWDVDNRGAGHCYPLAPANPMFPHEVYNNILVQTSSVQIARGARVADGSQVYDGNLYYRPSNTTSPLFLEFRDQAGKADFKSLAKFKASKFYLQTRAYYLPGWEAAGVEADPRLDQGYRPDSKGPAARGAIDLRSRSWPGATGEVFRGALAPIGPRG